MNLIVIGGVPGVGKTTVCRELESILGYKHVCFGTKMIALAEERDLFEEARWKMHDLPSESIIELEKTVVDRILAEQGTVLLEAQLMIGTEYSFYDGLPDHIWQELPISSIVVLEASPVEIRRRRERDETRDSQLARYRLDIEKHQRLNRERAHALSRQTEASFNTIKHGDAEIIRNAESMHVILELLNQGFNIETCVNRSKKEIE